MRHRAPWAAWVAVVLSCLILVVALPADGARKKRSRRKTKAPAKKVVQPLRTPTPPTVAPPKPGSEAVVVYELPPEPVGNLRAHSVNLSPLGVAVGDYAMNYQWMGTPGHALVVELTFRYSNNDDEGKSMGLGGQLGYRWLFNGTQDSYFLSLMAGYDGSSSTLSTTSEAGGLKVERQYTLPSTRWRVTLGLGRRWVFGPGFQLTCRAGIGPGKRSYARGNHPEVNHQADVVEALVNLIPLSLDSELSLGWVF